VLFNFLLRGDKEGTIGAWDFYVRDAAHGLDVFKPPYGMEVLVRVP